MEIKTVTISNSDLLIGDQSINKLAAMKFADIKHKFWLGKLLRGYRDAVEDYTNQRDELVKVISPKSNRIDQNSPEMIRFVQEHRPLMQIEIELKLPVFKLEELPAEITAEDITNLWFMIDMDELEE